MLGLATGALSLHGGVIRDQVGRIVAHLAMPAATSAFKSVPGVGPITELVTAYQLRSISRDVQQILNVSLVNTALSGLTLATSLAGFVYLSIRLRQINEQLSNIDKRSKELQEMMSADKESEMDSAISEFRRSTRAPSPAARVKVVVAPIHAANGCLSFDPEWVLTTASRSGFKVTAPIGVQFRVAPVQRRGLRSRAWRYRAWRAARISLSSPAWRCAGLT